MADVKVILFQALAGSALVLALAALTALPPVKALFPQWDGPLLFIAGLATMLALVAGLGVVAAQHWFAYSLAAGVWAIGAMLLGAIASSVFHAEATEKAGPAGMVFMFPFVAFVVALPLGLAIRFVMAAFQR